MMLRALAEIFRQRAEAKATLGRTEPLLRSGVLDALAAYEALEAEATRAAIDLREIGMAPDPETERASQARSAARAVLVELRHALANRNGAGVEYAGARIVAIAAEERAAAAPGE